MDPLLVARILSAGSFLFYGTLCLVSPTMVAEFERYEMPKFRVWTALFEIAGALGLIFGPTPQWRSAAAVGLCLIMVGALVVRQRINDPWYTMLPAAGLLVVNGWIAIEAWRSGQS